MLRPNSKAEFPSCKDTARALNQHSLAVGRKVLAQPVVYSGIDVVSKQGYGSSNLSTAVSSGPWSYIEGQLIQKVGGMPVSSIAGRSEHTNLEIEEYVDEDHRVCLLADNNNGWYLPKWHQISQS